jgi:hypothetical protein
VADDRAAGRARQNTRGATAALLTGAVPVEPGATVVAIVSGGNVDRERLRAICSRASSVNYPPTYVVEVMANILKRQPVPIILVVWCLYCRE